MRSAIEFETLYKRAEKKWKAKLTKCESAYKKKYPFWKPEYLQAIILNRKRRRLERLIFIRDRNHRTQSGIRRNDFLADFFAEGQNAMKKYAIHPYGNFIQHDLKPLLRKHKMQQSAAPAWYAYRTNATNWQVDQLIDELALHNILHSQVFGQEQVSTPESLKEESSPSTKSIIHEKAGLLSTGQLAKKLGKSKATIGNWARSGQMPCTMINGQYTFRLEEVEAWIEEKMNY